MTIGHLLIPQGKLASGWKTTTTKTIPIHSRNRSLSHDNNVQMEIVTSMRCGQWGQFSGLKGSICTTPDNKIVPDTTESSK